MRISRVGFTVFGLMSFVGCFLGWTEMRVAGTEPPSWRQFTHDAYLIGRGSSGDPDLAKRLDEARESARGDLIRTIRVRVSTRFHSLQRQERARFESVSESQTVSEASMDIEGVQYDVYEDGKRLHALAFLSRDDAKRLHFARADDLVKQATEVLDMAGQQARDGRRTDALATYDRASALFAALEDARAVLLAVDAPEPPIPFTRESILREVDAVENATVRSLEDAADLLIRRLDRAASSLDRGVLVQPFTYRETPVASEFSRYFRRLLEQRLGGRTVELSHGIRPMGDASKSIPGRSGAKVVLRGSYRDTNDAVNLHGLAVDVRTGNRLATPSVEIPKTLVVQAQLELTPPNYTRAEHDLATIAGVEVEVVSSRLKLELWTSRGGNGLALDEGERYKVYGRVNRQSNIRLIYHLAGGTRVVMLNEHPIPGHQVHQWVELGEFEVAPPFGVETIQGFAYAGVAPPLKSRDDSIDGVIYEVVDETLVMSAQRYKGFIKVHDRLDDNTTAHLVLTTLPKPSSTWSIPPQRPAFR